MNHAAVLSTEVQRYSLPNPSVQTCSFPCCWRWLWCVNILYFITLAADLERNVHLTRSYHIRGMLLEDYWVILKCTWSHVRSLPCQTGDALSIAADTLKQYWAYCYGVDGDGGVIGALQLYGYNMFQRLQVVAALCMLCARHGRITWSESRYCHANSLIHRDWDMLHTLSDRGIAG